MIVMLLLTNCSSEKAKKKTIKEQLKAEQETESSSETIPTAVHTITITSTNPNDQALMPLLGVISGPDQPASSHAAQLTEQYQDIGVTSVRNNDYYDDRLDMEQIFNCNGPTYPSWDGCDATDDTYYNWGKSDAQFQSYLDGNFEPFLRVGGEWENQERNHDFKGPQNATQEQNWIIAAKKEVERYNNWNGKENVLTYLNIWTEFPGEHFWTRTNMDFIKFWTKAYQELKATYPDLLIGGPGFGAGATKQVRDGTGGVAEDFLKYLYKENVKPDWFGWHIFSNDPQEYLDSAKAYKELLDGKGVYSDVPWAGTGFFDETEVIVDAYGNGQVDDSTGTAVELSATEMNEIYNHQKGAAQLTASWIAMQYSDIRKAYYYRGNDPSSSPTGTAGTKSQGQYGLFYGDSKGTYKPTAYAFKLWAKMVNEYPNLLTIETPSVSEETTLWAMAAENSRGDIAVLVANQASESVYWDISYQGEELADYETILVYQVDDSNTGEGVSEESSTAIFIPSHTVQMLVLKK